MWGLEEEATPFIYVIISVFVLSFDVAPYFQLKNLLSGSLHEKFWHLCFIHHSLKFTMRKTRELTGFFVSFFLTLETNLSYIFFTLWEE